MKTDLGGKVVLVTGASSGIGRATALIHDAVDQVTAHWGGVDVLIAAAMEWGDTIPRTGRPAVPFDEVPAKLWQEVLRSTVEGTYRTIQAVLPAMRGRP